MGMGTLSMLLNATKDRDDWRCAHRTNTFKRGVQRERMVWGLVGGWREGDGGGGPQGATCYPYREARQQLLDMQRHPQCHALMPRHGIPGNIHAASRQHSCRWSRVPPPGTAGQPARLQHHPVVRVPAMLCLPAHHHML